MGLLLIDPILCSENNPTSSTTSDTFLGINPNLAGATIAGVSGVVATISLPPVAKMKVLATSNAVALGTIAVINQAGKVKDWTVLKKNIFTSLTNTDTPVSDVTLSKKSSVLPLDFDISYTSILRWFADTFPDFITSILDRMPDECTENTLQTYQTLFTLYNLFIFLSLILVVVVICLLVLITILSVMKSNQSYLLSNYPRSLGKFCSSRFFTFLVIWTKFSIILNIIALLQAIYFLYSKPIPSTIGNITDVAIQNIVI